jgi:hypothetical protein
MQRPPGGFFDPAGLIDGCDKGEKMRAGRRGREEEF